MNFKSGFYKSLINYKQPSQVALLCIYESFGDRFLTISLFHQNRKEVEHNSFEIFLSLDTGNHIQRRVCAGKVKLIHNQLPFTSNTLTGDTAHSHL